MPAGPAAIIDAGGGSSRLCGALLSAGYTDVTVLDTSETAVSLAHRRLGEDANRITWIVADLLLVTDKMEVEFSDRAVSLTA